MAILPGTRCSEERCTKKLGRRAIFPFPCGARRDYLEGKTLRKFRRPAMNAFRMYPVLALGATAAIVGYALLSRRNKKPAEQLERERRTQLTLAGRIIDGNVINVLELEEGEPAQ